MNAYSQASHAASVATSKASEAALVAASQLNIHGRNLAKELVVHAQLGYEKSKQIYNDQYKVLWPKVKPHYDQHLAPLVNKAAEWRSKEIDPKLQLVKKEYLIMKTKQIDPRIKILKMESKKLFAKMVELYGTHCRATYKVAHQLAKDHDFMEHFQKVGPLVKESCDNAESSVTMLLRAMLILILLPFLGRIFGLLWAIMRLIVNIFLTVTLLRFILPRGTTSKNSVKEQPVPYKTKSNGSPKKRSQRRQ